MFVLAFFQRPYVVCMKSECSEVQAHLSIGCILYNQPIVRRSHGHVAVGVGLLQDDCSISVQFYGK